MNVDSDLTDDDPFISMLIVGAREFAEGYCHRSFVTQKWCLTLDSFMDIASRGSGPFLGSVLLEKAPIQSVDSIVYVDMAGNTQTITGPGTTGQVSTAANESKFVVDLNGPVGKIAPAFGQIWPITLPQLAAVKINFTAGYGDVAIDGTSPVPTGILNWIKMRAATLYQNREEVAVMPRGKVEALPYVDRLLDPYVVSLA
jgi:uncharacterized phiE125 gp8 family phage protein